MKNLRVNFNPGFELVLFDGPKGNERLKIVSEYPDTVLSRCLFSNLGMMHLISSYFPHQVLTNFGVVSQIKDLVDAMYKYEKKKPPILEALDGIKFFAPLPNSNKVAIAYSAGKDSMWNLWWASEKYGPENVLAVHIHGLNRSNTSRELEYTKKQQKKIGFNLKIIDLLNGSQNFGFQVMRSRDMFLAGIIIPLAIEFGASKVIIEGFAEAGQRDGFTGQEENMHYFNRILSSLNIPVQVAWRSDRKEMDCVKDLIINRPNWLTHVCNCFSVPCYQPSLRRSWQRRMPTLAHIFYDSQCGSCVKCRIINIARILHDPIMEKINKEDVRLYLKNTAKWIKEKLPTHADMINGSFLEYFHRAVEKYGLNNLKSSQR